MRSSAAGSTFSEYYGVNGNIGRAIMIIASLATVLLGLNKLVQIIGYISPVLLLEQGYEVHITYRRSAGKAEELMAANPGRLFAHKLDQGKIEEIENADFLVENEWYGVIFNAALGSGTVKEYADQGDPLKAANDVALMTVNALGPLWIYKKMEPVLLAEPGDVFLIPAPYYSSFVDDINERAGVIAVGVPCGETLDRNAFEAAYERVTAEGRRVRAVLFSSPNNPIGIVYKEDAVRHVIDFAMAHDLEIISDEIYAQTVFDPEAHYVSTLKLVPAGYRHRVHVTSSFAKDFVLSGFRTGMCFSFNPAIIQGFGSITYYSCVSSHTQSLLRALLQSPELEGVMDLSRQRLKTAYTVYGGTLLIRNDADGKSYLYDLLDVEKKKVTSKTSFSAETHSEVTSPRPSDTGILTDGENIKPKFSLKAYSEAEKKGHVKSAKEFFGETNNWNETGYITTDGTKLDFSGRHEGAPGGQTGRRGDGRDRRGAV